jgi:hypothetical protein
VSFSHIFTENPEDEEYHGFNCSADPFHKTTETFSPDVFTSAVSPLDPKTFDFKGYHHHNSVEEQSLQGENYLEKVCSHSELAKSPGKSSSKNQDLNAQVDDLVNDRGSLCVKSTFQTFEFDDNLHRPDGNTPNKGIAKYCKFGKAIGETEGGPTATNPNRNFHSADLSESSENIINHRRWGKMEDKAMICQLRKA